MAKTKSAGSSVLGRDSQPKYLGIKIADGQSIQSGQILIRQRGSRFLAGQNVRQGGDDTLYAAKSGKAHFSQKRIRRFDGSRRLATIVSVRS